MRIDGIGPPPYQQHQAKPTPQEKQALENEIVAVKQEIKQEAERNAQQNDAQKRESEQRSRMNEYYIKELLFLFSSRGNTETIEKLAKLLKRQKEMISR